MAYVFYNSGNCSAISAKELFMLEWSEKQKCIHIAPMPEQLKKNLWYGRVNHRALDYIPIAIGDDPDELQKLAEELDKKVPRYKKASLHSGGDPE